MKTSVKRRAKNCIRGAVLLACFIAVGYGQDNRNDQLGDNQRNLAPRIAPFNIQYVPDDVWH